MTALTPGILGAATVVAGLLWQVPSAAPAGAADSQVTFIPSRGQDISPMYLFTPAGCPRPATNVIATAYGAGFGDEGVVVVPNGHAGVRSDGGFGVPLQDTLNGFAAAQHTTLHGSYRIVVRCIDTLDRHTFATYTGTVSFADPHRYTARPPSRVPTDGNVPLGVLAEQFPELTAAAAAASGSGPSPGVAGAAGTTGDQAAEAGTTTAGRAAAGGAAATASGSSTPAAVAVLLGGGVLGCTVALGVRHRRRSGP